MVSGRRAVTPVSGPGPAVVPAGAPPGQVVSLARFCAGERAAGILPWAARLAAPERACLRAELALLLREPESTGEPLDWPEVLDLLREYAALAGWEGAPLPAPEPAPAAGRYLVDVHPRDLRVLERASPAVREAVRDLLGGFLRAHPTDPARLRRGSLKKLGERDLWQLRLPDGYRLRYRIAGPERVVRVVYLGPHPEGRTAGRERAARRRGPVES